MFNKRFGLILLTVFSCMTVIIACSSESIVDKNDTNNNNSTINPDNSGDNSNGSTDNENGGNSGSGGGDTDNGGSDGNDENNGNSGNNGNENGNGDGNENGNGNGNEKPNIAIPAPTQSNISLECNGKYYTNDPFTLEIKTSDNRDLNGITWKELSNNRNVKIINQYKTAQITVTKPNYYRLSVLEAGTNYNSICSFQVLDPKIELDSYNYLFNPGESKKINFRFTPNKFTQGIDIENKPEGYNFTIHPTYIEVQSLKKQGTVQIVLVSKDKKFRSLPISLSSSNEYSFTMSKTTDTNFKDKAQKSFVVKVTKGSKDTSYRLEENLPYWIHYKKQVSANEDQYTFTVDENDRIMQRSHEVVFLPGDAANTKDKRAQKFTIKQDRNFIPVEPQTIFFRGTRSKIQEKFDDVDYANQHYKKRIPELFLYENNFKGWYNANKIIGNEKLRDKDSNMCWMYTAVNAIHWWLEHNKEEIKAYMDYNKPEVNDKEKFDKGYYNTAYKPAIKNTIDLNSDSAKMQERENKSDVAKLFRQVFTINTGGHPDKALLWYLAGIRYENHEHQIYENGFGMFKDIFPNGGTGNLLRDVRLDEMTYEKFNNVLKRAKDNERILFTNVRYNNGALHAINIWGYVIDKYGDVFEVYVADNNLPSSIDSNLKSDDDLISMPLTGNPSNSYLVKRGIDINEYGNVRLEDLQGTRGSGPILNVFHELDLGKKYFEDYFKKINN